MTSNGLRKFSDVDDLFDNIENTIILEWVNAYHAVKTSQRAQGKRYRVKQTILAKLAEQYLEADELKRVKEQAAEEVDDETV